MQPLEFRPGGDAQFGVEVGQRLVEQKRRRLADDGPADRDALALAAGELLGLAIQQMLDVQNLGRLASPAC